MMAAFARQTKLSEKIREGKERSKPSTDEEIITWLKGGRDCDLLPTEEVAIQRGLRIWKQQFAKMGRIGRDNFVNAIYEYLSTNGFLKDMGNCKGLTKQHLEKLFEIMSLMSKQDPNSAWMDQFNFVRTFLYCHLENYKNAAGQQELTFAMITDFIYVNRTFLASQEFQLVNRSEADKRLRELAEQNPDSLPHLFTIDGGIVELINSEKISHKMSLVLYFRRDNSLCVYTFHPLRAGNLKISPEEIEQIKQSTPTQTARNAQFMTGGLVCIPDKPGSTQRQHPPKKTVVTPVEQKSLVQYADKKNSDVISSFHSCHFPTIPASAKQLMAPGQGLLTWIINHNQLTFFNTLSKDITQVTLDKDEYTIVCLSDYRLAVVGNENLYLFNIGGNQPFSWYQHRILQSEEGSISRKIGLLGRFIVQLDLLEAGLVRCKLIDCDIEQEFVDTIGPFGYEMFEIEFLHCVTQTSQIFFNAPGEKSISIKLEYAHTGAISQVLVKQESHTYRYMSPNGEHNITNDSEWRDHQIVGFLPDNRLLLGKNNELWIQEFANKTSAKLRLPEGQIKNISISSEAEVIVLLYETEFNSQLRAHLFSTEDNGRRVQNYKSTLASALPSFPHDVLELTFRFASYDLTWTARMFRSARTLHAGSERSPAHPRFAATI